MLILTAANIKLISGYFLFNTPPPFGYTSNNYCTLLFAVYSMARRTFPIKADLLCGW
jgi:hypothetical protein